MDRTSKTAPLALRENIMVSESRNRHVRENIYTFKIPIGKDQQGALHVLMPMDCATEQHLFLLPSC